MFDLGVVSDVNAHCSLYVKLKRRLVICCFLYFLALLLIYLAVLFFPSFALLPSFPPGVALFKA